jgi:CBS domain-containing protein
MRAQRIADWMSTPPIVVAPTLSLADAHHLIEQRHVRRLPIVQDARLVGILTWRDLRAAWPSAATTLSVYEWRALFDQVSVAECMTRDPRTVAPSDPVLDAAQCMLVNKIGGLPVVVDGRVVGVITESDLMRLLITEADGPTPAESGRELVVCGHCGTQLRGRSFETIGPDDTCWQCHYHLHRCENCRHFDGVGCLLDRSERHTAVPGRHCAPFAYRRVQSAGVERAAR